MITAHASLNGSGSRSGIETPLPAAQSEAIYSNRLIITARSAKNKENLLYLHYIELFKHARVLTPVKLFEMGGRQFAARLEAPGSGKENKHIRPSPGIIPTINIISTSGSKVSTYQKAILRENRWLDLSLPQLR